MKKIIRIIVCAVLLLSCYLVDRFIDLPLWGSLLIYLVPYLLISYDILLEAFEGILGKEIFNEDLLMCIATIGALCICFLPEGNKEFLEAVFVMMFFQIGEVFEEYGEEKSRKSISSLMDIRPDSANVERETLETVNPNEVKIGEIIVIKPGEKIPLDGIVVEGNSSLNTVALTGESVPRDVDIDDEVISGCINISGLLRVKVTRLFSESTVSKILDLVENASGNKAKSEKFITKFARIYTPLVVISALILAFIPPLFTSAYAASLSIWLNRALTFLIVSCPCALVLSVPLSFFCGIGGASRIGILIKGSNYMEVLSKVDTVVFDKTGTLTLGVFAVTAVHPEKCDSNHLLHYAAHVERYSTHPIALSLRQAYEAEDDDCLITDVEEYAGKGIKAKVNEHIVYVGNSKLMEMININYISCEEKGTIIHVSIDDEYMGHIVISDKIKENSKETVSMLKDRGIKTVMLTGDHHDVGENVAKEVGIDEYYTDLFPDDKVNHMKELVQDGTVAFVGDGINDAPVLAISDLGISMGAIGSDAAIEASDVVLMDDNIGKIYKAIDISTRTIKIVKQNIILSLIIKITILILAAFGLVPMWLAIFGDVGVLIIAVLNATRASGIKKEK